MRLAGVLLAGGQSKRMGQDKAALPFGNQSLLGQILHTALPWVEQLLLVLGPGQRFDPRLATKSPKIHLITDPKPHLGPLYALGEVNSFLKTDLDGVLVLSCDLPYLTADFLAELVALKERAEVAAASWDGIINPLLAIYDPLVLRSAKKSYRAGETRAKSLLIGPQVKCLENRPEARGINTPEDYQAALKELFQTGLG